MSKAQVVVRVAVPAPLRRLFDYRVPADWPVPQPGSRVRVPFGRRYHIGVVLETGVNTDVASSKLRDLEKLIDDTPVLPADMLNLLNWVADYYLAAPGEVYETALPVLLRQDRTAEARKTKHWQLTPHGREIDPASLVRAPVQQTLMARLRHGVCSQAELLELGNSARGALKRLQEQDWVVQAELQQAELDIKHGPDLSAEQQLASDVICSSDGVYGCHVLHGVTGSGKTEVYLQVISRQLRQGLQALVLVPEIGLTPQLLARFRQRFGSEAVAVMHSGLADGERLNVWLSAQSGQAAVVIGTRSAVFVPMPRLGVIVVDEEHDTSFKQQEGVRYHGRDVAVMRAYRKQIPVVLGSATPSLETLYKCHAGNYKLLVMHERAAGSDMPAVRLIDMRNTSVADGLSPQLVKALQQGLQAGEQSIIYLNRRGFAPVYMCYDCGWVAQCPQCETRLVYHHRQARLRCHHCGHIQPVPASCPVCAHESLHPLGDGTEKLEAVLAQRVAGARVARLDRDSISRRGSLEACLDDMAAGRIDILVGTQMLSKGHDFPNVTLVGVINADQGLYSVDYRGSEHLVQQVMQVAGRAGRREQSGTVLIQTWHPDHAVFNALRRHDYQGFVDSELSERKAAGFPPYAYLALLRAEAVTMETVMGFLTQAAQLAKPLAAERVTVFDPVPAPMTRRAGRYRGQLLIQATDRAALHGVLQQTMPTLETLPEARKVRWSLDVDPVDLY
jgi:primosomal protein N' (replication factor Y)